MPWSLREQVSFCWVGDRPVFLDMRADRYYCLRAAAEHAFRALAGGGVPPANDMEALTRTGVVEPQGAAPIEPTRAPQPESSLVDAPGDRARFGPAVVVEVAFRLARARGQVVRTPFSALIARVRSRNARLRAVGAGDRSLRRLALDFSAARRICPHAIACLPDALAMLDFLGARGFAADLVFGVRLNPFTAHCWVQAGAEVLNDGLGAVTCFTPILVV
ncbi:MAG: lasso peptide biosynthesis B2 protein [Caulobacteraceae bacterium]|nr:lasso peptide biosynthesis B2 protein [Caulobacteraceae bacterium]